MKIIIFFVSIMTSNAFANSYKLGRQTISLPFEKTLLAKTSSPEENLVFFDSSIPSPRPIFNAALSVFTYPDNLSSFEIEYRREKERWLEKEKSELIGQISIKTHASEKAITTSFRFKHPLGIFEEWARFEQCSNNEAISLKWMIPEATLTSSAEEVAIWKRTWDNKICP